MKKQEKQVFLQMLRKLERLDRALDQIDTKELPERHDSDDQIDAGLPKDFFEKSFW